MEFEGEKRSAQRMNCSGGAIQVSNAALRDEAKRLQEGELGNLKQFRAE